MLLEPVNVTVPGPVTVQLNVKPAAVSAVLGSVAVPVRTIAVPQGLLVGSPVKEGEGATLLITVVEEAFALVSSLSWSVAVKVTV